MSLCCKWLNCKLSCQGPLNGQYWKACNFEWHANSLSFADVCDKFDKVCDIWGSHGNCRQE